MTYALAFLVVMPLIALSVYGSIGIDCIRRLMRIVGQRCGMEPQRRPWWNAGALISTLRIFATSPLVGLLMVGTRGDRRARRDLYCMFAARGIERVLCGAHRAQFERRLVHWRDCYPGVGPL